MGLPIARTSEHLKTVRYERCRSHYVELGKELFAIDRISNHSPSIIDAIGLEQLSHEPRKSLFAFDSTFDSTFSSTFDSPFSSPFSSPLGQPLMTRIVIDRVHGEHFAHPLSIGIGAIHSLIHSTQQSIVFSNAPVLQIF